MSPMRIDLFERILERRTVRRDIAWPLECCFRVAAHPGQRCPEIVGHVVQCLTHPLYECVEPAEEVVEQRRHDVQRI